MIGPRWKKMARDLAAARGRMAMMVLAIAVSVFGVGTILSAYTILTREISRNYLGTNPASAFLLMDRVDDTLLRAVRQRTDVQEAEATSWVTARIQTGPGEWKQLLLFVIPDFDAMRIDTFLPESGAWPPATGTMLVEREALKLIKARVGDMRTVQTPNGSSHPVAISGTVHDPGLAPAWQEQTVYGYAAPATLAGLGEADTLHILKVVMKGRAGGIAAVDAGVSGLAGWLKAQGRAAEEIRIPPPGMHPHQGQMSAVLSMLLAFAVMALVLSAILTATMVNGLLAQQIRQIGIMKAIGARSRQIGGLYLALILFLGAVAVLLGLPPGIAASRGLAGVVASLLNFTLYSQATPAWVYVVLVLMGILVPLVVAEGPIWKTTRTTVRKILNDYGTSRETFRPRGPGSVLGRVNIDRTLILALRNTFRRRGRLLLTLGLLAAAGAMFMTGINVKSGWERFLSDGVASRRYDLEIRLNDLTPSADLSSTVGGVNGVQQVETASAIPIAVSRPDGLDIVRTYPDGGHGSLTLRSTPAESRLLDLPILRGRWLLAADADGIVLNQLAAAFFPGVRPGDAVRVSANGRPAVFHLVGVVRQVMTPATAYVTPGALAAATGLPALFANSVRVVMREHDAASVNAATGEIVGALGLMSTMGTSVTERTREFGVMRAIGAKGRAILRNVMAEGLFTGLMSWFIAAALSVLPTFMVDSLIGGMFSRVPLPLVVSPAALGTWPLVIVVGSVAASASPAWRASRLTVRETLSYV